MQLLYVLFGSSLFIGIAPTNIIFYLFLLVFIIKAIKTKTNPFKDKQLNWIIGIYCILILFIDISLFEYNSVFYSIRRLIKFLTIFIIIYCAQNEQNIKAGIWAFIITGVLSAGFSIISYFTHWQILSELVYNDKSAIIGFGGDHHIRYANKLVFALILLICYWYSRFFTVQKKNIFLSQLLYFCEILILAAGILYTGSRGAIIGLVGGMLIILFIKKYGYVFFLIIILAALIYFPLYKTSPNVVRRINQFESDSQVRLKPWGDILANWGKFKYGFGTKNYSKAMEKTNMNYIRSYIDYHAHNNIIHFLIEYGILGVIIYIVFWTALIILLFKRYLKYKKQNTEFEWLFVAGLWIFLTFQFSGLTETTWVSATLTFSLFFIIGSMLAISKKSNINYLTISKIRDFK